MICPRVWYHHQGQGKNYRLRNRAAGESNGPEAQDTEAKPAIVPTGSEPPKTAPRRRTQRSMWQRDRRHYAHRDKVERTFSWLKQLRRLATRWEDHAYFFQGF